MNKAMTVLSLILSTLTAQAQNSTNPTVIMPTRSNQTASGQTESGRTASQMIAILQSKEVGALLSVNDGVGNLEGVEYAFSGRASFGPAYYDLKFASQSGPTPQTCAVRVALDIEKLEVTDVSTPECK